MAKASRFFRRPSVIGLSFAGAFATSMALLALLLGFLTGWSFGDNYMALLIALFALFMLLRLRNLIFVKPKAGPVLLEAGAYPERNWYIVGIVAYLVLGLLSLDWNQNFLSSLKSQACTLVIAAYFATLASIKLQVLQGGLWLYTGLLPRREIRSYYWQNGTLHFKTEGLKLGLCMGKACFVPEAHVEAFETYLQEHGIPDNSTASVVTA